MEFSSHARRQIEERNIQPELVWETLRNPGQVVAGGRNRKVAQRVYEREGRDLLPRVVFCEEGDPEIVTV